MEVLTRCPVLNNIPEKKLAAALDAIKNSKDDLQTQNIKLTAINRYAESNIPIEYWALRMEKDFIGDPRLLAKYNEYILDIKASYIDGKSICFAGHHGTGKQIALDTELPTPNGFIKLAELKEGDQLFDEQGNICNVTQLHQINLSPKSYEIIFDDGTRVEACEDHLWQVWDRENRSGYKYKSGKSDIKSTKELLLNVRVGGKQQIANYSIPCTKPLNYNNQILPIDPYVLGCWLGDGTTTTGHIESADIEIINEIEKAGYCVFKAKRLPYDLSKSNLYKIGKNSTYRIRELTKQLKENKLLGNKHIPNLYLISSYEQRLSLLQGLLDTDGSCNKGGAIEYCTVLPELAYQVCELVRSLGIKSNVKQSESWLYNKRCKDRYRISFSTKLPVFKLKRKLNNIRLEKTQLTRTEHRFILEINEIAPKAMRCITVDSPSHLFLITRSFLPTHNTMTTINILKKACQKGFTALYSDMSNIVSVLTQASNEDKFIARRELSMVDFLAIDEVDQRFFNASDSANELFARNLESVFRTRSQNKLPTLMCTNSPNIKEAFTGALKASLGSLMSGNLQIFPVFGNDFRSTSK